MNSLTFILGIAFIGISLYYIRDAWTFREQETYRNKIHRSLETLNEIQEHAKEFNSKEIIKVHNFNFGFLL